MGKLGKDAAYTTLDLWRDGHALKVKTTGAIYCVAQSEKVAIDILRSHETHAELLEALKELKDDILRRQRKHDCAGFDCATCSPIEGLYAAQKAIAKAEGR